MVNKLSRMPLLGSLVAPPSLGQPEQPPKCQQSLEPTIAFKFPNGLVLML